MNLGTIRDSALPILARRTPRPALTGERRVLIVQPDHLGDIILSEPAVRYLRASLPDAQLIAVIGPWSAEITRMAWPVDGVIEIDFPGFVRESPGIGLLDPYRYLLESARRLRLAGADDALVLRDDAWWAAWLVRASVGRTVVTGSSERIRPFGTATVSSTDPPHRTAFAMRAVGRLLGDGAAPDLDNKWDMSPVVSTSLASDNVPDRLANVVKTNGSGPYIALHPGSGAPVKSWPAQRWRAVIRELHEYRFILTGTGSERELCREIADGLENAISVAGLTPLPELAAILRGAVLAAGTDNGPMHLAGAVGTPTLRLFGPSDPARYGPWPGTPGQSVLRTGWSCPRCGDLSPSRPPGCGCMLALDVATVSRAFRTALSDDA